MAPAHAGAFFIDTCTSAGRGQPQFHDDGTFFKVVLYKLPDTAGKSAQEAAVRHIKEHGHITRKDVEKLLGVKERWARQILHDMVKAGILQAIGRGKGRIYILNGG